MLADLDTFDPPCHIFEHRGIETRLRECTAERIRVISDHVPSEQRSFNEGRSASHKRIVDHVAGPRETINEEPRELSLETSSVGDLVERRGLALFGSPEFTGESLDMLAADI